MMKDITHAKRLIALFLTFVLIIGLIPSAGIGPVQAKSTNSITVKAVHTGKLTIPVKSSYKLEATAKKGKLTYKSSRPKIVKVSKKGTIKGLKTGKATITIKGKGVSKKIKVTVVKKKKYKKVRKITFKGVKKTMYAGDSQTLRFTFKPANASNKNLKFKSSKKSVATVSAKGLVKAIKPGSTNITVTSCANKKAKAKITIKVKKDNRYRVTFDSQGGTKVATQKVAPGKKAKKPADPTLSGATFAGWFLEGEEKAFDFSQPINSNITLIARWDVKLNSLTKDGEVDPGDLALLEAAGEVEVMGGTDSNAPKAIIGRFTDKKIKSTDDARDVLDSIRSLYNMALDEDGNAVTVDFNVKKNDISSRKVSTPADKKGFKAPDEVLYRYSPTLPNGVRVEGGDIIIATDTSGNVTGLNATYNPSIYTLGNRPDSDFEPDPERIRITAINYVMDRLDTETIDTYGYERIYSLLDCQSELIVSTGLEVDASTLGQTSALTTNQTVTTDPFYAYKVRVTTISSSDSDPDHTYPDETSDNFIDGEQESEVVVDYDNAHPYAGEISCPAIDWTVYIDAADFTKVHSAYSNISYDSWIDTNLPLTRWTGDTKDTDLRYKTIKGSTKNQYEFYNAGRKISVFPLCTRTSENGSYVYGPINRDRTEALKINLTPSQISTWRRTANTLLANMETVYDFYNNSLGRKSFDDKGSNVYIGYYDDPAEFGGTNANAGWWGKSKKISFTRAVDGVDYSRCLDVIGHEFTHGVIDFTVGETGDYGFKREGQSGSLDEAYCDIMGEIIQKNAKEGDADDWGHGENCRTNGTNNPSRDLANPSGDYHSTYTGKNDKISFYYDSTIFSHAAYLMMTDPRIKNQISMSTWGQLFYRSLSRLSTDSKFIDARYAVLGEAAEMKFTGAQQYVIHDVFDKVGIKDPKKITLTLTWGSAAGDMDLYLLGPFDKTYYEVNYSKQIISRLKYRKSSLKSRTILASLDKDCRTANGTEVIRIHTLEDGNYYCMVHYPGSDTGVMGKSKAHVVAQYGDGEPLNYYARSVAKGTWWLACRISVNKGEPTFFYYTRDFDNGSGSLYRYGGDALKDLVISRYK